MKKEYTIAELIDLVDKMGCSGGGTLEVTGPNNGEPMTIVISQTEWKESPVCMVGGYGQRVKSIYPDNVREELPDVLDYYFDSIRCLSIKER